MKQERQKEKGNKVRKVGRKEGRKEDKSSRRKKEQLLGKAQRKRRRKDKHDRIRERDSNEGINRQKALKCD